jgi:hypothetical protein
MKMTTLIDDADEERLFRMSISYSLNKPDAMRCVIETMREDPESLYTILDIASSEGGPDGLRSVLLIFKEKEIYLNPDFVDEMIGYVRDGRYKLIFEDEDPTDEDIDKMEDEMEEMADLYSSYPYLEE